MPQESKKMVKKVIFNENLTVKKSQDGSLYTESKSLSMTTSQEKKQSDENKKSNKQKVLQESQNQISNPERNMTDPILQQVVNAIQLDDQEEKQYLGQAHKLIG